MHTWFGFRCVNNQLINLIKIHPNEDKNGDIGYSQYYGYLVTWRRKHHQHKHPRYWHKLPGMLQSQQDND